MLLAAAGMPAPPPVTDFVDADLLLELPDDLPQLLQRLPQADLYLQDEVQVAFHPTLTRVWCRKGRRGQRLVEAPGANAKVYGFGIVDWCDGWFDGFLAPGRTAAAFCAQVRTAVARSRAHGRVAIVLADNLRTHTVAGSKLVRQMLAELPGQLYMVYTPPMIPMPIGSRGCGDERGARYHTPISAARLTRCGRICGDISSAWPSSPTRCCVS